MQSQALPAIQQGTVRAAREALPTWVDVAWACPENASVLVSVSQPCPASLVNPKSLRQCWLDVAFLYFSLGECLREVRALV